MRTIRMFVVVAMVFSLLATPTAVGASGHDTISGTVTLDGVPLAGVEVFLFDSVSGALYTCTDESGFYEFHGVTFAFIMATGPEVVPAIPCDNSIFFEFPSLGQDGRPNGPGTPLVATFGGFGVAPSATVDFEVSRLPQEDQGLFHLGRQAMIACWDQGNLKSFEKLAASYFKKLDKVGSSLTPDSLELYERFGGAHFQFILDEEAGCPPGA